MAPPALSDELAQVRTKKKRISGTDDRAIPWGEWVAVIHLGYYKEGRGKQAL